VIGCTSFPIIRFPSSLIPMTSRLLPALRVAAAVVATGLIAACSQDTGPTVNTLGPRARVRVINAVPDTIAMDYRFVDSVEAPIELGLVFRGASGYQPFKAGTRQLRAFAASQNPTVVFGAPILDKSVTLEADQYYTIIHVGLANTAGGAGDSIIVLKDSIPTLGFLGTGIGIRGIHAIPSVGAVDVFTTRTVAAALPATPAFAGLTYGRTTGYIKLNAPDSVAARVSVQGAAPAVVLSALAMVGQAGTTQLNPIGGSRIAGTSLSAVAFPAGVGARATGTATAPSVVWFVDGDPPETVPRLRP
jgi:hypothetical protein